MRAGETPKPVGGDTFLAYVYRVRQDGFQWCEYTRESLMEEVVHDVLGRAYWSRCAEVFPPGYLDRKSVVHAHLRGLLTMGLSPQQVREIREAWADWWSRHGPQVELARRIGSEHARELGGDTLRDMLSAVGASTYGR